MSEFEKPSETNESSMVAEYKELWLRLCDLTEADTFIESVRVPSVGPLDIEATAEAIGVPVTFSVDMVGHAMILGLNADPDPIEILVYDNDNEKAVSFAHEVGHYVLYLTGQHRRHSFGIEEEFCEYFGRKMSMPEVDDLATELLTGEFIENICDEYQVSPRSFIIWLMENDLLPERLIVDTRYPITPNPDYSQVVTRNIVCLGCEYGECNWEGNPYNSKLPILDLTDKELSGSFTFAHSMLTKVGDPEFKYLQELYARP